MLKVSGHSQTPEVCLDALDEHGHYQWIHMTNEG